jgi:hypothetical protein
MNERSGWKKLENANSRRGKKATFPSQALSWSGSTGIISALPPDWPLAGRECQHPGNFNMPVFRRLPKDRDPMETDGLQKKIMGCNIFLNGLSFEDPFKNITHEKNHFRLSCRIIPPERLWSGK